MAAGMLTIIALIASLYRARYALRPLVDGLLASRLASPAAEAVAPLILAGGSRPRSLSRSPLAYMRGLDMEHAGV